MESSANPGLQEMQVVYPEQSVQFGWMLEHGWQIEVDEFRKYIATHTLHLSATTQLTQFGMLLKVMSQSHLLVVLFRT